MTKKKLETFSFEGVTPDGLSVLYTATMTSGMKIGLHGNACGVIFRAHIVYATEDESGPETPSEILFLVAYMPDWRDKCVEKWEESGNFDFDALFGQCWKN